jgi:lipid II:glycine glycyltransferase (peptidoglycan interpeptide bridge formation enzyme)
MLEIENSRFFFKTKTIWFSEIPFDIDGLDGVLFQGCTRDVNLSGFSKQEVTTLVIDLNQDLNKIWNNINKSSRRAINKAKEMGVNIRINQGYDIFYNLNSEFRKLKGLPRSDIDIEFMKENGILFLSELDGEIIAGQFYLSDGKNFRTLIGASRRLEENIKSQTSGNSKRLLIWEAIKYAKENGMITFDMGGYYTGKKHDFQKENINKFKKSFGGKLITNYKYQKSYSHFYTVAKWIHLNYKRLSSGVHNYVRNR